MRTRVPQVNRVVYEIVQEMDGAGVDRSVLFISDLASRMGDPPFSIEEENRLVVEANRRYHGVAVARI